MICPPWTDGRVVQCQTVSFLKIILSQKTPSTQTLLIETLKLQLEKQVQSPGTLALSLLWGTW